MGVLENKSRARLFYKYLSKVYDRINPYIWNEEMLDEGEVTFYRGDAERLPFKDDAFDVLWSSGSIEYWPNPVDALEEFRRVVKPGHRVLVVGPDYPESGLFQRVA